MSCKFPTACIRLAGTENAYAIMNAVEDAMHRAKIAPAEFKTYRRAAMAGDYEDLLRVTRDTVHTGGGPRWEKFSRGGKSKDFGYSEIDWNSSAGRKR